MGHRDQIVWALGQGKVLLADDGAPLAFTNPTSPGHRFLLQEGADPWHTAEHRWGTGFVITDGGAGRWQQPVSVDWDQDGVLSRHQPRPGLSLRVQRSIGAGSSAAESVRESYTWRNTGERPLVLGSVGINTPFRDLYVSASDALSSAVHAHVFVGGTWAWVLAEPMSGDGPVLGLIVREGALAAYSVESRNLATGSNVRGHLVLQATDQACNPAAFGGQQPITLDPGMSLELAWDIAWFPDRATFLAATHPPVTFDRLATEVGRPIIVTAVDGSRSPLVRTEPGVAHVDLDGARTAVLFHPPLEELVGARVRFILDHQPAMQRAGPQRFAFVPFDNATGLTQTGNGWVDWSDGSERLAMPTLLQEVRLRGWPAAELDDALQGFALFARTCLLDEHGTPRRGSDEPWTGPPRIYDSPWLAHFFATQFAIFGAEADLDLAERVLRRSYALGADRHLSIGQPEAVVVVADLLDRQGRGEAADNLRRRLMASARYFAEAGADLPAHEVNYEQSMVAPLVSLLAAAHRVDPDSGLLPALRRSLRWLRAFGGPQPHVRLNQIAIRHWDGFWFGAQRQWGDVFPHHWSCLTAVALARLPPELTDPTNMDDAEAILTANLANFHADGRATCAFVLPSAVDGQPGYRADTLANDQDWALTLWLRLDTPAVLNLRF